MNTNGFRLSSPSFLPLLALVICMGAGWIGRSAMAEDKAKQPTLTPTPACTDLLGFPIECATPPPCGQNYSQNYHCVECVTCSNNEQVCEIWADNNGHSIAGPGCDGKTDWKCLEWDSTGCCLDWVTRNKDGDIVEHLLMQCDPYPTPVPTPTPPPTPTATPPPTPTYEPPPPTPNWTAIPTDTPPPTPTPTPCQYPPPEYFIDEDSDKAECCLEWREVPNCSKKICVAYDVCCKLNKWYEPCTRLLFYDSNKNRWAIVAP